MPETTQISLFARLLATESLPDVAKSSRRTPNFCAVLVNDAAINADPFVGVDNRFSTRLEEFLVNRWGGVENRGWVRDARGVMKVDFTRTPRRDGRLKAVPPR